MKGLHHVGVSEIQRRWGIEGDESDVDVCERLHEAIEGVVARAETAEKRVVELEKGRDFDQDCLASCKKHGRLLFQRKEQLRTERDALRAELAELRRGSAPVTVESLAEAVRDVLSDLAGYVPLQSQDHLRIHAKLAALGKKPASGTCPA
jgi:hypothetical protein